MNQRNQPKRILFFVVMIFGLMACSTDDPIVTPTPIDGPDRPLIIDEVSVLASPTPTVAAPPTVVPPPTRQPATEPPAAPPTSPPPQQDPVQPPPVQPEVPFVEAPTLQATEPPAAPEVPNNPNPADPNESDGGVRVIATYVGQGPSAPAVPNPGAGEPAPGGNPNPEVAGRPVDVVSNIDFEGGQYKQTFQEINVPLGWTAWWREGGIDCWIYSAIPTDALCPSDTDPGAAYKRPEFTVISSSQSIYAGRVYGNGQAARFFCTYAVCWGGYYQQVPVTPGNTYVFSARAFAWCATEGYNINQSKLETNDDRRNCQVAVGIDPTGGSSPYSGNIIWSGANYYDNYGYLETPPITATGNTVTLFLRGRSLWGFLHTDFHFDDLNFRRG